MVACTEYRTEEGYHYCCVCDKRVEDYDMHMGHPKHINNVIHCWDFPEYYYGTVIPKFRTNTPRMDFPQQKPTWKPKWGDPRYSEALFVGGCRLGDQETRRERSSFTAT